MIEDIKMANRISSYGLGRKGQYLYGLLFFVIGLLIDIFSRDGNFLGGFYIILSGMFIYQMVISTSISSLVQSSPYKYKIMVKYPYIAILPWLFVQFLIVAVSHYIKIQHVPSNITYEENLFNQNVMMLTLGIMILLLQMYFGICYKFFYAAIAGFCCIMIFFSMINVVIIKYLGEYVPKSYLVCCAIALGMILAGWGISYLLAKKLYKYDLHKAAFKQLTRNMKK